MLALKVLQIERSGAPVTSGGHMLGRMERLVAEEWITGQVNPTGPIELIHERPWSTVFRVPVSDGIVWFKACSSVQSFEPRLSAELFARWPDRVSEVLACDERSRWLLLADAGTRIGDLGNSPNYWLVILPLYAELQRGEAVYTDTHLAEGVPDLRVATLPGRYHELLGSELPLVQDDRDKLRGFAPRFEQLCSDLSSQQIGETIQHDDLHMNNVYTTGERLRILDWGDSSISHPFASLVVTLRFFKERNGLADEDPVIARIRDAYLEPWGRDLADLFALGIRVGVFANAIAALRQRAALSGVARDRFDRDLAVRLRRALARVST